MSGLECDNCGGKLRLVSGEKLFALKNSKKVGFTNTPLLVCSKCKKKYTPYATNEIFNIILKTLKNGDQNKDAADVDIIEKKACEDGFTAEEVEIWYDFDKIKDQICNEKYIAEKVKFIYDKDDYYFIPGLKRPWNIGFLTPVFFNIEVLLKYIHHPEYGLDMGANTLGYIYKGDEHYISFGINENNKVIMWLGDIIGLDLKEQFYLRSENVESDHAVASEFYEAQIEVMWAKASSERKLLQKRLEFNEKVRDNYNLAIAQLDTETLRVSKNICKLLINTTSAFNDLIIPLAELFIESINNKDIAKNLEETHPELKEKLKGKKGIKLLQLWMEKNTENIDVNKEIAPLFVLYDLRLVSAHLYSDDSKEQLLSSCCTRLGLLKTERDFISISNKIIETLYKMYDKFNKCLSLNNMCRKGKVEHGE